MLRAKTLLTPTMLDIGAGLCTYFASAPNHSAPGWGRERRLLSPTTLPGSRGLPLLCRRLVYALDLVVLPGTEEPGVLVPHAESRE